MGSIMIGTRPTNAQYALYDPARTGILFEGGVLDTEEKVALFADRAGISDWTMYSSAPGIVENLEHQWSMTLDVVPYEELDDLVSVGLSATTIIDAVDAEEAGHLLLLEDRILYVKEVGEDGLTHYDVLHEDVAAVVRGMGEKFSTDILDKEGAVLYSGTTQNTWQTLLLPSIEERIQEKMEATAAAADVTEEQREEVRDNFHAVKVDFGISTSTILFAIDKEADAPKWEFIAAGDEGNIDAILTRSMKGALHNVVTDIYRSGALDEEAIFAKAKASMLQAQEDPSQYVSSGVEVIKQIEASMNLPGGAEYADPNPITGRIEATLRERGIEEVANAIHRPIHKAISPAGQETNARETAWAAIRGELMNGGGYVAEQIYLYEQEQSPQREASSSPQI